MFGVLRSTARLLGRAGIRSPAVDSATAGEANAPHEILAQKLEWRRHPDPAGRYLNVYIEQNNTCNLKCRMCGFSDPRVAALPRYHMDAVLFESIARQLFPATTYLHMSLMTEPFMTADFPDRLKLVGKYGVPYSRVVTNGTLLNERSIEKVLESQITALTFSIDGGTSEIYEDIRIGSRLSTVLSNIELFKSLRRQRGSALPRLQINHVLMERNVDHFDQFLALLDRIQPEQVDVRTVEPMTFATGSESRDPAFFEKVRRLRPILEEYCRRSGIEDCGFIRDQAEPIELYASGRRMTCRRPWDSLAIHANGDVHPCMSWTRAPVGNLARQTFAEIWQGEELAKLRREFELAEPGIDCQHCTIKKSVPANVYDDFFMKLVSKQDPRGRGGTTAENRTPPRRVTAREPCDSAATMDVIIVHYHAAALVRAALEALHLDASGSNLRLNVIVADNGSTAEERQLLRSLDVTYLDLARNAGYAGAVNAAFALTTSDIVVLMNEDVLVVPGCLRTLRNTLRGGAAVAGPRFFWDRDRQFLLPPTEQRTRRNELLKVAGRRNIEALRRARQEWRAHARRHWRSRAPMSTTSLSGALLAFRRDAWSAVGPFDEGFFLYFEENDWLERVARAGLSSFYQPAAEAIHLHNPVTARSSERERIEGASFARFGNRYYGERFMRRLFRLAELGAVAPEWPSLAGDSITIDDEKGVFPLWAELSPSPLGYPAATTRIADPQRAWTLPAMRGLEFEGALYLQIVDDTGRELPRRYRVERNGSVVRNGNDY